MPFIVTAKNRYKGANHLGYWAVVSRRAVTTLEENPQSNVKDEVARAMLRAGVVQQGQFWARAILGLTESGGTVGPLPDETEIEVGQVSIDHLYAVVRDDLPKYPLPSDGEIIATYNTAQETSP